MDYPGIPIPRHIQDTLRNCGRACAQMIIAGLTLKPSVDEDGTTVMVTPTQHELLNREPDRSDNPQATNVWMTHPDEMLHLLRNSPELKNAQRNHWYLRDYPTPKTLVSHVLLALENEGMPSAVTRGPSDHWILVSGASVSESGESVLHLLDPEDTQVRQRDHTYIDECADCLNGVEHYVFDVTLPDLLRLDLRVGPRPNPVVNGTPLTDYARRCVGIFFGDRPPSPQALAAKEASLRPRVRRSERILQLMAAPDEHVLFDELNAAADSWGLHTLGEFLATSPETVASRLVTGIEDQSTSYMLMNLVAGPSRSKTTCPLGLMAVFLPDGTLVHTRFTNDEVAVRSLAQSGGRELWWSRQLLPTLATPFFPLVRDTADTAKYVRLVDNQVIQAQ